MLTQTVPQSRFLGQPLTQEDVQSKAFILEVSNIVVQIDESLDEGLAQFCDVFEIDDYIRENSAKQQLLQQVCSFLLQRPVAAREVVSTGFLTSEAVDTFFFDFKSNPPAAFSPAGESVAQLVPNAELEALRKENARLQAELEALRKEKALAEEQAISAMRRRPTRHNHSIRRYAYPTIDDMISDLMTEAVAEGVRQVLGEGKANV